VIKGFYKMPYNIPHFINGLEIISEKSPQHSVYNPATGEVVGGLAFATQTEIENAVSAAAAAFPAWSNTAPGVRARILFEFRNLLKTHMDKIAAIVTREHGKIWEDSRSSIARAVELVEYYCGIPNLLKGEYSENVSQGLDSYTLRQALGVCVGVSPFNFPVMVPVWMLIPSIACGNTFILKPSEKDPSASIEIAKLLKQSGLPDGVLNVIQGDKTAVDALITHPQVAAVSCVGSTPVAEHIYRTAVLHGKRAHTFGGAKNHAVIMPDAHPEHSANTLAAAAYGAAGERCMAISAVAAIGDSTAENLIKYLKPAIAALKIGPGVNKETQMGPLITREHRQRVKNYVDLGVNEGASLIVDGRNYRVPNHENGFFMGPCLFDQVKPDMKIYREEIFGPVLVIVRTPDLDSALKLVNEHEYGNGVALFTHDGGTARNFASQVKVGMVGINVPIPVPASYHSFGGWKRSWFGDIHMHSESIAFYTQSKSVSVRWPEKTSTPKVTYSTFDETSSSK
jgi:malonate-semialdehyde dehydrogenase (acetylating)/methylmalonate-semialdehyde dehydrogenase